MDKRWTFINGDFNGLKISSHFQVKSDPIRTSQPEIVTHLKLTLTRNQRNTRPVHEF